MFNKRLQIFVIFALLGQAVASRAFAEDIDVAAFLPSPRAVYYELRSVSNTYLATLGAPEIVALGINDTTYTTDFTMAVAGGVSIGANYAETQTPPANGMIVEGILSVGVSNPSDQNRFVVGSLDNPAKAGLKVGDINDPVHAPGADLQAVITDYLAIGKTNPTYVVDALVDAVVISDPESSSPNNQGIEMTDTEMLHTWKIRPGGFEDGYGNTIIVNEEIVNFGTPPPTTTNTLFRVGGTVQLFNSNGLLVPGRVDVGVISNPAMPGAMRVAGDVRISGYYRCSGTDLAESFSWSEHSELKPEPGDVVRISSRNRMQIEHADRAYDSRVAGVIATDPGMLLGQDTQNGYPVALAGRVPVKVTNEGGTIDRGDYLVAASTPGFAMKADAERLHPGVVLGKALERFDGDKGKVLMLVQ